MGCGRMGCIVLYEWLVCVSGVRSLQGQKGVYKEFVGKVV